jgi:hypothetical protein
VSVSVAVPPCVIDNEGAEAASVKLPEVDGARVQAVPLIENEAGILFVTPFQVASNPMLVALAPAARAPL